jgi:pimeloyl-ACP methyl ester carboxylesterase
MLFGCRPNKAAGRRWIAQPHNAGVTAAAQRIAAMTMPPPITPPAPGSRARDAGNDDGLLGYEATREMHSRFVEADGVAVHLIEEGPFNPPQGAAPSPAVLLLSAQWLSAQCLDRWASLLAQRHRVIRIDLPGHGPTGPFPDGDYSAARYVRLIDALLVEIAPGPYVLVGASFSGIAAAIHAARAPKELRGLVLATSSGLPRAAGTPQPNAAPPNPAWADENEPRPHAYYAWKLDSMLRRPITEHGRQSLVEAVTATNERAGRGAEAKARVAGHDPDALTTALRQLRLPLLVQWSSDSTYLPPAMAEQVAALTAGPASVRHYPDTGHLLLLDAPDETARDLLLFLETLA